MASTSRISSVANWLWLFLLLAIFALFFALRKVREENAHARADAASLRLETIALRHEIETLNTKPAPPIAAVPAVPSQTKTAPKPAGRTDYTDDDVIADPDLGAPVLRRHRRYAMANYRGVIDAMQLAPADKERLKQLIIERWNARVDVSDILRRQGGSPPELRQKMMDEMVAAADREIRQLLGEDGFAKFESVRQEQSTKKSNWGLFTAAWDAGAPLSDEQQMQVARAMLQMKKQFSSPEAADEIDPASGLTRADIALLEISASFLSPEQVAVILADKMATADYRTAVREAEQRKRAEAAAAPTP